MKNYAYLNLKAGQGIVSSAQSGGGKLTSPAGAPDCPGLYVLSGSIWFNRPKFGLCATSISEA